MRLRQLPIAIVLALLLSACGGTEPQLAIGLQRSALAPNVTQVLIGVHTPNRTCDGIRASGHGRPGTYNILVTPGEGGGEISGIIPNLYTVFVWGLDDAGNELEWGCQPSVNISNKKMTTVNITVMPIAKN